MVPQIRHVVPVDDDSVDDRRLHAEEAKDLLSVISNVLLLVPFCLSFWQVGGVPGATDNCGKRDLWRLVTGKTGFGHGGSTIHNHNPSVTSLHHVFIYF